MYPTHCHWRYLHQDDPPPPHSMWGLPPALGVPSLQVVKE